MSDCRFAVSPVNYPDPDPDPGNTAHIRFLMVVHVSFKSIPR